VDILIGIIFASFALAIAVGLPSNGGFRHERRHGRQIRGHAHGGQNIAAEEVALALDGTYMPALR
jgi:hypothetical protein